MRERLGKLIAHASRKDPKIIVLSGDHGYSLFDDLRKQRPNQFLNVGVAEQSMVGIAAGLAQCGFKPIVYGLASFVPIRVLEQIKLDVCYSNLPITFIGDGAGLSYSMLGASHHCGEDIACLKPLPNMTIYTPSDKNEMKYVFQYAIDGDGPSYIRVGRGDLDTFTSQRQKPTGYQITNKGERRDACIIAHGSMVPLVHPIAVKNRIECISVNRMKPFPEIVGAMASTYEKVIVVEEHSRYGALYSSVSEEVNNWEEDNANCSAQIFPLTLKDKFADQCGSWKYALSEHGLDEASLNKTIGEILHRA